MSEPSYEVLWPLGKLAWDTAIIKHSISDLTGKTIGELSDYGFRAEEIFPIIRNKLREEYPDIKIVEYPVFGNTHGSKEAEVIANLPALLKEYGCDAVISGIGS